MKDTEFDRYALYSQQELPDELRQASAGSPRAAVMGAWATLRSWIRTLPLDACGGSTFHVDLVRKGGDGVPDEFIGVFRLSIAANEVIWAAVSPDYLLGDEWQWRNE